MLHIDQWKREYHNLRLAKQRLKRMASKKSELMKDLSRLQTLQEALPSVQRRNIARQELQALPERDPILDREQEIVEVRQQLGATKKALEDRVNLQERSKQLKQEARGLLQSVFDRPNLVELEPLPIEAERRQELEELIRQHRAVVQTWEQATESHQAAVHRVETLEHELNALPQLPDVSPLRSAYDALLNEGDLERELRAATAEVRGKEAQAENLLQQLRPCWQGSLQQVPSITLPQSGQIEDYRYEFEQLQNQIRELQRDQRRCQQEIQDKRREWDRLQEQGQIPSRQELTAARADRDTLVDLVRTAWLNPSSHDHQLAAHLIDRYAPNRHLLDALVESIRRCDSLADRLRDDADRVSRRDTLQEELASLAQEQERLRESLDELQRQRQAREQAWHELWRSADVTPGLPADMLRWLQTHAQLRNLLPELVRWQTTRDQLQERIATARERLQSLLGLDRNPAQSLRELLELAGQRLRHADQESTRRRDLENQLAEARLAQGQAARREETARHQLENWNRRWQESLRSSGLQPSLLPQTVQQMLHQIDESQKRLREAADKDQRIKAIEQDWLDFLKHLDALREQLEPDWPHVTSQSIKDFVERCETRVSKAKEIETKRANLQETWNSLNQELKQRAARIPLDLETFCQQVIQSADGLEEKIQRLSQNIEKLDAMIAEESRRRGAAENQLRNWRARGPQAADLQQDLESLESQLQDLIEDYAVYLLAERVVQAAIEDYRQQHQNSMLRRAEQYFQQLTCGAFEGLEVDVEGAEAVLLCRRAQRMLHPSEDPLVRINGLSDGTRDQLFLALRLAGIEEHLDRVGPMPVIADDLLVNFDNPRTEATLRCLAELSQRTQVLLLTHHEHVRELARRTLREGENLFCYEL
jgi:uncharacterized protein YhaN